LPEYEHLIVDEAHHLEDQATTQFGFVVDQRLMLEHFDAIVRTEGPQLIGALVNATGFLQRSADDEPGARRASAAADRLRHALDLITAARAATADLFARLGELIARQDGNRGGYDRTLRLTHAVRGDSAWVEVELVWERLEQALREIDAELRWFMEAVERVAPVDGDTEPETQGEELSIELGLAIRTGADLATKLQSAIGSPDSGAVHWIERGQLTDRISLHAAPLHVNALLQEQLFGRLRTAVLTSATITTDGTFEYMADRLGLRQADELSVASPFDYERSTLLYLVDDIPEPNQPGYQRRLQETLIGLCDATRGRALVLFTSHAALQSTYQAIKQPLEDEGIVVLAQKTDGSPRQLVERLKHATNIVVLGTATFWEGVDVVGPALSLLVITKLPFAVPSDPVFAARSELFDEPFLEYAVPQAVLKFKQGFGRLIRSSHDRGVCAVLDRRVISKRYGASFVQSLPECSVQVGSAYDLPEAALDWLR
jgi:DNA polymerase-3 subunit epsilon/ATP-dependent DNA helicase DinG